MLRPARPPLRLAICLIACALLALPARASDVTVFAAASLKTALDEIAGVWEAETGSAVTVAPAGSAALARQIQQGAPADLFLSASPDWMDVLDADGLIRDGTRRDLLTNRLVLIGHGQRGAVEIGPDLDLAGMLGEDRLAMALVDAVPAGIYGKAALETLGIWDSVAPLVAQTDNVRAALALVATGEAPLGIVYATDAGAEPRVSVLGVFPAESHAPIVYPAAVMAESEAEGAAPFLDFLEGTEARAIFTAHGFGMAGPP